MDKTALLQIGKEVRQWALNTRPKGWPTNLNMMCARASGELYKRLKQAGYDAKIVFTPQHAYVAIGDTIVDVTATQFGKHYPPIVVRPKNDPILQLEYWTDVEFIANNLNAAIKFQEEVDWTPDQRIQRNCLPDNSMV